MAWLHTEVVDTIGPLEYVLNTPSHHRVHHSRNPEYIDKNYGGVLIIWDRLFGTFKAEDKSNPPVYGLIHQVRSYNPIYVQFHPWPNIWRRMRRAEKLQDKLGVIFNGPGWRPGLKRLGNPHELPRLVRPVNSYDPVVGLWWNIYVVIHFGLLLFFYHELTLYQDRFRPLVLNVGILSLLASITSLGLILDNKKRHHDIYELMRCLLFFGTRHHCVPIIMHGLARTGLSFTTRILIISSIYSLFALSVLLISLNLGWKIFNNNHGYIKTAIKKYLKNAYLTNSHNYDRKLTKSVTPVSIANK